MSTCSSKHPPPPQHTHTLARLLTHTHTRSLAHTHPNTHSHTLYIHTHTLSLASSHTLLLACSHTPQHKLTYIVHTHTHSLTRFLSHTLARLLTHTYIIYTHTFSLACSHTVLNQFVMKLDNRHDKSKKPGAGSTVKRTRVPGLPSTSHPPHNLPTWMIDPSYKIPAPPPGCIDDSVLDSHPSPSGRQ